MGPSEFEPVEPKFRRRVCMASGRTFYVYYGGKQGSACFFDESCYRFYLTRLINCLKAYRFDLHTYALLPGELHLLVSAFSRHGLVRALATVNEGYDEYFRNRFQRSCLPLERRPVCRCLTDVGSLVLDVQKYIELAPVRAGLVTMPGEYPWTGYTVNAFGGHGQGIVRHRQYRRLCARQINPFAHYRDFIATPLSAAQSHYMKQLLRSGYPLVSHRIAERDRLPVPAGRPG